VSRFMTVAFVSGIIGLATMGAAIDIADAQQIGSAREGRRLAHAECAQCHGVGRAGISRNPAAPAFEDIADIPGMTSTALTVAFRTWHPSMPNFVINGRDAQNIIAYIMSLKNGPNSSAHRLG
jgi:mono/diheme cytochrome c family protein